MTAQVFRWEFRAPAGELNLPLIPWEGGPDYWTVAQEGAKMTKAEAAGWSDPSFFPICVFYPQMSHASTYQSIGINTYMAIQGWDSGDPLTDLTNTGMFGIVNYYVTAPDGDVDEGWSPAQVGSNPNLVGWFIYDEAEQGEIVYWDLDVPGGGGVGPGSTETERLTFFQSETQDKRDLADGRFMFANFGNGVMGSFWAPNTMDDFVQTVDACCIDKYAYTSPGVRSLFPAAPNWPDGANARTSAAYGWFASEVMTVYNDQENLHPAWVFLETKMPLLNETDAEIILYAEIRGAVWSAIANEARGIAYFDQNGNYTGSAEDPNLPSGTNENSPALINAEAALRTYVTTLNEQVLSLAPVLNTQSYVFDFDATGIKTMLKAKDGFAYIFASVDIAGTTGSKTFTVTGSGITGTNVEVVDESRSLTISGGTFSDTFANEYSHHIYKVAI